ncbi:peptidase domain-containing ABC transporter [Microbacterium foliorum]|uniref:peptidase domain-containing ABC transporter n=1 Tax=Microbacterium foliorum TaxID=104336 RepID=UPI0028D313DF|nr:peptidase domain-containing ABC transporter [Microbacterium foliorum]
MPYFPQVGYADCGPACVFMAFQYLGVEADIATLREQLGASRDGVRASDITRVVRSYGLDARGVRAGLSDLRALPPGSILFWRFNHFVVLEEVRATGLTIVDPASGRQSISFEEADSSYTGLAIEIGAPHKLPRRRFRKARRGPWRTLAALIPRAPYLWVSAIAASALVVLANVTLPMIMRSVINAGSYDNTTTAILVGAMLGAVLVAGIMHLLRSSVVSTLQGIFEDGAGKLLVTRLLSVEYGFFLTRHPGDLAQRVRIGGNLRQLFSTSTVGAGLDAVLITAYLFVMTTISITTTLIALALLLVAVLVAVAGAKRQSFLAAAATDTQVRSVGLLHEVLDSISSVKALGAEQETRSRWSNLFAEEITAGVRSRRHLGRITSLATWLQFATPTAVFAAGLLLLNAGALDLGSIVAISALSASLFTSVISLVMAALQLASAKPELERVSDILDAPLERLLPGPLNLAPDGVSVTVKGLDFRYPGSVDLALTDITLHVDEGDYLGVLGVSGSGKSSLGMLLAGLIEPTAGSIQVAEYDVSTINVQHLRRQLGYVEQNSRLISGSIIDNLRLGVPDASIDEVRWASQIAEIDEFITSLPMGYETVLGSRGEGISGGQRQRIALARAVLKRPPLLILDEATSAVDPKTEAAILRNIRQQVNCTLIVIAHRLNLVQDADHIAVLDRGALLSFGAPADIRALRKAGSLGDEIML